jgi:integrative and conjugative element protein (TIGR02256 family)
VRARSARLAPGKVWLTDAVLEAMVAEARGTEPLESGGVLLGWQDGQGMELVVARIVGPGPRAVHRRTRFSPDDDWQREQIADAYVASGRTVSYLGDWHSHPGGGDTPSRRDERTARRIARSRSARARRPVMLILSGEADTWLPSAHRFTGRRLGRVKIERIIE